MDLHPDFKELIDKAVQDAVDKHVKTSLFDWKVVFQGVIAGIIVTLIVFVASGIIPT